MSIREKLRDLKRRLSDRRMYSIVLVIIGAVSVWGLTQYKQAAQLRQRLDNQYNRSFYEVTGYVNNVETLMLKAMIASSPGSTAGILQEAWRQANMAQENLGQLPVAQPVLANTSKFLTQIGDLSYALNNQSMAGKPISEEQYKTLEQLYGFSTSLSQSLNDMQANVTGGRLRWGDLERQAPNIFQKTSANLPSQQFENIDKTFQDYPKLIYDGPFSDHMVTAEPRGITGKQMSGEQAKQGIASFFGPDRIKAIDQTGSTDTDPIKTYTYNITFKDAPEEQKAQMSVTQVGGMPFWMIYNRPSTAKNVSIDQAKDLGRKFLDSKGFKNMVDTYYLAEDGTATINYAYKQGDVVVYSDLIKLKIALDNGEIIGFEGKGYISSHTTRNIAKPKISMEDARKKINPKLQILSQGLAIIPTDFKTELYTYEFKGKLNNKDFLMYINADTGKEEKVLIIINTPNGILTM